MPGHPGTPLLHPPRCLVEGGHLCDEPNVDAHWEKVRIDADEPDERGGEREEVILVVVVGRATPWLAQGEASSWHLIKRQPQGFPSHRHCQWGIRMGAECTLEKQVEGSREWVSEAAPPPNFMNLNVS